MQQCYRQPRASQKAQRYSGGPLRKATVRQTTRPVGGQRAGQPSQPEQTDPGMDRNSGAVLSGSTMAVHSVLKLAKMSNARTARARSSGSRRKRAGIERSTAP